MMLTNKGRLMKSKIKVILSQLFIPLLLLTLSITTQHPVYGRSGPELMNSATSKPSKLKDSSKSSKQLEATYDDLSKWERVNEKDDITVYSLDLDDSGLLAFRGITVFNTSIEKLYSMIRNDRLWPQWVEAYYKGHYIETIKKDAHYIVYQALDLPIVNDRDVVFESKITWENSSLIIRNTSVEHKDAPETVGVRADMRLSKWKLTPMPNNKVKLDMTALTDVKGSIPDWIINIAQKQYIASVLSKLKKVLKNEKVGIVSLPLQH